MKCSLGISNCLEEISSLSPSVVFLYFFALITEESSLISPCYFLELCIQMGIAFFFSLPLASLLFSAICKASSDSHFAFLHFFSVAARWQVFFLSWVPSGLTSSPSLGAANCWWLWHPLFPDMTENILSFKVKSLTSRHLCSHKRIQVSPCR